MKFVHLVIAILFLLFAYWQWNDPDSILWIFLYLIVAVVAFSAYRERYYFVPYLIVTILTSVATFLYIPDVAVWVKDGMPSLTESMKASSPYIELVREFFGLFISLVVMCFYLVRAKKKST